MNETFNTCLELFKLNQSESLCEKTINRKVHEVNKLLLHIEAKGIQDFYDFNIQEIYNYINSLEYATQTKSGLQFTFREFFCTLHKYEMSPFDGYQVFPVIFTNKRDRILSHYSTDEIKSIISQIDINADNGLRDKCMVLLAAQTGLRSSDILGLTFDEILWDKNIIQKIQQKTSLPVSVPLPENIKYLLIDYIKNKRPESDTNYVFINPDSSLRYSETELYFIFNKYLNRSSVSVGNRKHGPHALRHSLAAKLLDNNTPMPVITGILGHKDINTTSKYLSIDIEGLRKVSLEVPTDEN